jgi:hypothetical protein
VIGYFRQLSIIDSRINLFKRFFERFCIMKIPMDKRSRKSKIPTIVKYGILDFSWKQLSVDDIFLLNNSLIDSKLITRLDLFGCKIRDSGIIQLCGILKVNNSISSINLGWNDISYDGMIEISDFLSVNHSLTWIDLSRNNIDTPSSLCLGEAIKLNRSLCTVNLNDTDMEDFGVKYIGDALRFNRTLTSLKLGGNKFGEIGLLSLNESLKGNNSITFLGLERNSTEIGKHFVQVLYDSYNITSLNIGSEYLHLDREESTEIRRIISDRQKELRRRQNQFLKNSIILAADETNPFSNSLYMTAFPKEIRSLLKNSYFHSRDSLGKGEKQIADFLHLIYSNIITIMTKLQEGAKVRVYECWGHPIQLQLL